MKHKYNILFYNNVFRIIENNDDEFVLQKGWALKENQKYGNMGGGVRMSKKVVALLQYFFQADNAYHNDRYTAAEMLAAL